MRQRHRRREAGFTLIEIMVVVAIIVILAAVVIPSWMKETRKGKYDPEVRAMFSEISVKEEQYRSESATGIYIDAPTCPATVSSAGVDFLAQTCYTSPSPSNWAKLRMTPTDTKIRCTYTVVQAVQNAAGTGTAPAVPASPAGFTLPASIGNFVGPWFYILAECDMDAQGGTMAGGTNTAFLTTSWDTQTQKVNYGQ